MVANIGRIFRRYVPRFSTSGQNLLGQILFNAGRGKGRNHYHNVVHAILNKTNPMLISGNMKSINIFRMALQLYPFHWQANH